MGRTDRRQFMVQTCGGLSLLPRRQAPQPRPSSRPPNILFLLADDLGYADIGCYGQKRIRTPHIDRLAAAGMRFTDAYSGSPVCAPSRCTLMTGLHTGHCSVRANAGTVPIPLEDVTLAEVLKGAGYATGLFGKWGLGDAGTSGVPEKQGFDEYFGYLHQIHAHFYYPDFLWKNGRKFPLPENQGGRRQRYSHDLIVEEAQGFIRRHKDRPFFCYVAFTIPHWELLVPDDSLQEYKGKFPEKPFLDDHYASQEQPHAVYAAMITRMDRDIGRLVTLIKELGLEGDTLVFFTSDNGPAMPLRGDDFFHSKGVLRGHKGNLYEGGIRVPFIARWPERIAPGSVSHAPCAFWDVLPTLSELARGETPAGLDGISIVPELLQKGGVPADRGLYWEHHGFDRQTGTLPIEKMSQAIRLGQWKGVRRNPSAPLELYDLVGDVAESRDQSSQHPDIASRLERELETRHSPPRTHAGGSFEYAR